VEVSWDEQRKAWYGHAFLNGAGRVDVLISPGQLEPAVARSYAEFVLPLLAESLPRASRYAARRLIEYYNYYQAHLPKGEQITVAAFADRLRLEGIRFRGEGVSFLDFAHDLYRDHEFMAGGLVVVEASADARFRQAYWISEPDAREARSISRLR
jgi:hypothetical protein